MSYGAIIREDKFLKEGGREDLSIANIPGNAGSEIKVLVFQATNKVIKGAVQSYFTLESKNGTLG